MRRNLPIVLGAVIATALASGPVAAQSRRSDAVVLVNSASPAYVDYEHYVKPYLDHFGIPYGVLDVAGAPVTVGIGEYALIVIGHRQLDDGGVYLDATEQGYIASAVSGGAGLVNFDNDLSSGGVGRYAFVQSIFGFGYGGATSGSGVSFPSPQAYYITARHSGGIGTGDMTLAGVTLPGTVTAVATTGSQPFLAVTTYGTGRAVQWGSYEWMSTSVLGPMYGLDDLVWRSLVWAARKPFVMQGLPPFLTMRVDDESGNFEWIHIANEFGIKPWAGLFFHNIDDTEAADLSALTRAGWATAAIHAKNGSFFYFNHGSGDFDAATVAANFAEGTAWHAAKNIPIAKYVLPHYYEFGTNIFQGLDGWGVEFVGTQMDPGQGYGAPWVMNGPFRLYESGGSGGGAPQYYADYMAIPGHPEFNGRFFNCVTEIRDDAGYEWYPNLGDVPGTIGHGTRQLVRALDAMALPTLFTHGYYVSGSWGSGAPAAWRAILSGITANIASYNPIAVTMDDACRYIRAVHDSDISDASYDPSLNRIGVNLSGHTDVETKFYLFDGTGEGITQTLVNVPQFTGSAHVDFTLPGPLVRIDVTPNPASVVAGASRTFTAAGFDADGNPIPNLQFVWSATASAGTIDAVGRFTAGVVPGTYTDAVTATFGSVSGRATVTVTEPILDHFDFATVGTPKYRGLPFSITITARDAAGNQVLGFIGSAALTDSTGTVTPSTAGPFVAGVWQGPVTIGTLATGVTLHVSGSGAAGNSNAFDVIDLPQGASSLWPTAPTPSTPWNNDTNPLEVGVKFRSAVDGTVSALRFYKGAGNTGAHVGHLWDGTGHLLAEATFTNETATGWQQVALVPPVAIHADTTYVASYHTGTGYAADRPYFTTGVDSPPLRALRDGEDGGNGVYKYDSTCSTLPCFPDGTYQSTNYWVDVVFLVPDDTPPTVASTSPVSGATGVSAFVNVTATFSEAMDAATISSATFTLRQQGSASDVPATVSYSGLTATLDPAGVLAYGSRYTATISGSVRDPSGNPMGSDATWTFDTATQPQCPCSIWPGTATPQTANNPDVAAIEVGVKFRSSLPGFITAIRFYKGAGNTGVHVGHLWDTAGNLLGQATFTGETSSGWQEAPLASPVAIQAGTTYIASYHSSTGYAIDRPGFAAAVDNPPLRALADGESGGNGVYKYDSTCAVPPCMPDLTYQQTNYWTDVVFNTADSTAPTVSGTSPAAAATGVDIAANVTASFSETMNAATFTTSTFRLRALGAGSDFPAAVSYAGLTATLDPTGPLAPGTTYEATVSGSVTDVVGNSLGADYVWTFTTANVTSLIDTTAADFGAALASACSVVAHTSDGEVTLAPAMATEFDGAALPAGWVTYTWNPGGSAVVSGGRLTVKGVRANPDPSTNNYGPGRSLEFVATYATATQYQQCGFGGGLNAPSAPNTEIYNTAPMTTFTTEGDGANLFARAWASGGSNTVSPTLGSSWLGGAHRYRIVWNASSVDYFIDGVLRQTLNSTVTGSMRPAFSVYFATQGAMSVDWMRMSPFASSCSLESRIIDAGHGARWLDLTATGSLPAGTAYAFETRTGNTATPDGGWSPWAALSGSSIVSPNGRYLQYRATLTTSDDRATAELQQVTVRLDSCTSEICNGLDDDCDGVVDNGNPGGGGACASGQPGVCAAGTELCAGGTLTCVANQAPAPEACNGLDDDCDGVVDNGHATIAIPDGVQRIPGDIFAVPVSIGPVTGMGVFAAELDITFSPTVLELLGVAEGGALGGKGCALVPNVDVPGHVMIAVYCGQALDGNGSLADVTFRVAATLYGTSTELGFATAKLNEGCPAALPDPGSFLVRGPELCDAQDNDGDGLVDENGSLLCDDGIACTADACTGGACVHPAACSAGGFVHYYRNNGDSGTEPSDKPVPDVAIDLNGGGEADATTDASGGYAFSGLAGTVTIAPLGKSEGHSAAISSLDASAVAMASVGSAPPLSVNQLVAGDVTGNRTLSALDASYIARYAVGLVPRFPVAATSDWAFLRCVPYGPPDSPGCVEPLYSFAPIARPETANFYAVLYGEVTGNWTPPGGGLAAAYAASSIDERDAMENDQATAERLKEAGVPTGDPRPLSPSSTTVLSMPDDAHGGTGSAVQVPIMATPGDGILGIDMTLHYDPSVVLATNVSVSGIAAAANFALVRNLNTAGTIIISMYATQLPMSGSGEIARIDFNVVGPPGSSSSLTFVSASVNEGGITANLDHGAFTVTCAGVANGTSCSDGNACTSGDQCVAGACVGTPAAAPAEIAGVAWLQDKLTLAWSPAVEVGAAYDVVRGSLAALPVGPGGGDETCLATDLATATVFDGDPVPAGGGYWYLVRAATACARGTYGLDAPPSGGAPAPRTTTSCP